MQTKTKLTVTIDSEVLPRAKEYARRYSVSLSGPRHRGNSKRVHSRPRHATPPLEADAPTEGTSWAAGKTIEEIMVHLDDETDEERQARWEDKSLPFGTRLLGQIRGFSHLTDDWTLMI